MTKQNHNNGERKAQIMQELREAIKKHGLEGGPAVIRDRYPDIPRPTWHRYLAEVSATPMEQAIDAAKRVAKQIPAPEAVSPAYVAERPVESRQNFSLLAKWEGLYRDAEKLRAWSVTADDNVKVPQYFMNSIKLRCDLLEAALKAQQQVYDMERMQRFYDIILEEIGKVSPEAQRAIMDRLVAVNSEIGMTVDARPQ